MTADPRLPLATNNLSDFSKVAADRPLQLVHPELQVENAHSTGMGVPGG